MLRLAVLGLVLLLSSLGCSLGQVLVGEPTPTPTRVSLPPLPTWTPLPPGQLPPAAIATLTVEAAVNLPTLTPTPLPTPTSTPVADTPTPLPTPTPVPYVEVVNQNVNVRQGPSLAYPIIGQATAGDLYDIIGRNEASTWWKVCCYDGQEVWIFATLVTPFGSVEGIPVVSVPQPPPVAVAPPAPAAVPTATPEPPPPRPFALDAGPEYFPTTNPWLTVWVRAYSGRKPYVQPVGDLQLRVLRDGVDVSKPDTSGWAIEWSAPFVSGSQAFNNRRREYNLKYEYLPAAGNASWTIYLVDQNGTPISDEVSFRTEASSDLREVFVGFFKAQ